MNPARSFCILTIGTTMALAQDTGANGPQPVFDVISVKPRAAGRSERIESYCAPEGRFITHGTPLLWSIKWAYGLNDYQMSDAAPAWLNSFDTWDIDAETEASVTEADCRKMVQALFEERFSLRMHSQIKTVSAYALTLAKSGPKFSRSAGKVTINGAIKKAASEREAPSGWTTARLANYLASVRGVQRPVIDRTMLEGAYGFTLTYSIADGDDRPDIFAALSQQLGLRLRAIRTPIEMWFVDRVDKPGAN